MKSLRAFLFFVFASSLSLMMVTPARGQYLALYPSSSEKPGDAGADDPQQRREKRREDHIRPLRKQQDPSDIACYRVVDQYDAETDTVTFPKLSGEWVQDKNADRVDELLKPLFSPVESIFPSKPRDVVQGAIMAVSRILFGSSFMLASTIWGLYLAYKNGSLGVLLGTAEALVGFVVGLVNIVHMPIDLVRGLWNTPAAVLGALQGKNFHWDDDPSNLYRWRHYHLLEEYEQLFLNSTTNSNETSSSSEEEQSPKKKDPYKILGVSSNASYKDMKAAFSEKAKPIYTDMNRSPDTDEELLELRYALDTLSLTQKPPECDPFGYRDTGKERIDLLPSNFDASIFFNVLFGPPSEVLDAYIGGRCQAAVSTAPVINLVLASQVRDLLQNSDLADTLEPLLSPTERQRRVVEVAMFLKSKLDAFNPKEPEAFQVILKADAQRIIGESSQESFFGWSILSDIGKALQSEANLYLSRSKLFDFGLSAKLSKKSRWVRLYIEALSRYRDCSKDIDAMYSHMGIHKSESEWFIVPEDERKDMQISIDDMERFLLQDFLKIGLTLNSYDIQATLQSASWRLFHDRDVSKQERKRRA